METRKEAKAEALNAVGANIAESWYATQRTSAGGNRRHQRATKEVTKGPKATKETKAKG